jgi:hypothetical protein
MGHYGLSLYVDDVRTTQETPMGHHCLLLYVDDVRTTQETHLWATIACYYM